MTLRKIPDAPLGYPKPVPSKEHGPKPKLEWLPLAELRIDDSYQREVLRDGRANIRRIVEQFRWSHFAPLVVTKRPDGVLTILDGQHRAFACRALGIEQVPCQVVSCEGEDEEAHAFEAINGNVTKLNGLQIFYARLAARDPKALALRAVCTAAGVTVPRNCILVSKPGETLAIGTLQSCLKRYGKPVLELALCCITQTARDGNVGLVRAPVIHALCDWLTTTKPPPPQVLAAIESVTIRKLYEAAQRINAVDGGGVRAHLVEMLKKRVQPLLLSKAA